MAESATEMDGFELGTPALVCRWRLSRRRLPLANRHMRALLARSIRGERVSKALVAWAKQHVEWTLEQGSADNPDGVLMLIVDEQGRAAMTVGPYVPLEDTSTRALLQRAERALDEQFLTSVAPETLWSVRDGMLVWDPGQGGAASGTASLVEQLAQTMGIAVRRWDGLLDAVANGDPELGEVFLVSDEHGVVPARDAEGPHGHRLAQGYLHLLATTAA